MKPFNNAVDMLKFFEFDQWKFKKQLFSLEVIKNTLPNFIPAIFNIISAVSAGVGIAAVFVIAMVAMVKPEKLNLSTSIYNTLLVLSPFVFIKIVAPLLTILTKYLTTLKYRKRVKAYMTEENLKEAMRFISTSKFSSYDMNKSDFYDKMILAFNKQDDAFIDHFFEVLQVFNFAMQQQNLKELEEQKALDEINVIKKFKAEAFSSESIQNSRVKMFNFMS